MPKLLRHQLSGEARGILDNDRAHPIAFDPIQQRGEAWTVLDRISARDCRIVELLDYLEACPLGVGGDCRLLALIAVLVLSDVGRR